MLMTNFRLPERQKVLKLRRALLPRTKLLAEQSQGLLKHKDTLEEERKKLSIAKKFVLIVFDCDSGACVKQSLFTVYLLAETRCSPFWRSSPLVSASSSNELM